MDVGIYVNKRGIDNERTACSARAHSEAVNTRTSMESLANFKQTLLRL